MLEQLALPPGISPAPTINHVEWWDKGTGYILNHISIVGDEEDFMRQLREVLKAILSFNNENHPYANGWYSANIEVHKKLERNHFQNL